MSESEAYAVLARLVRATMSARKLELYAELRHIESFDEMSGYELVRAASWEYGIDTGMGIVRATDEQKDAFRITARGSEWRGYIADVIDMLKMARVK